MIDKILAFGARVDRKNDAPGGDAPSNASAATVPSGNSGDGNGSNWSGSFDDAFVFYKDIAASVSDDVRKSLGLYIAKKPASHKL